MADYRESDERELSMKGTEPTSAEWQALYKTAADFREIEPWKWVEETDLFGVQDPVTGEVGYCCVMGELGEVLGMAVYLGTRGLNAYRMIRDEVITLEDSDFMFVQDCLLVSFENKSALDKEDRDLIRQLGVKAKGKRAWPMFRRHEPGYFPWFLEPEDVQFLTLVLQQAIEVSLRLKDDKKLLNQPGEDLYLVRTYRKGAEQWEDAWLTPEPLPEKALRAVKLDDLALQRIKKNVRPSTAAWEIDFFHVPAPVDEGGRPFYPYSILIVDKESGFILDAYISEREKALPEFVDRLLACFEKNRMVPAELLVKRQEVADLFFPLADKLEIRLRKVDKLPALEEARSSMETDLLEEKASAPLQDEYCGDDQMEEYLQRAGSELSIFGLYGLIYGCLAAPNLVMPSVLIPAIFGKDGAIFETESQAQKTIGSIMALWKRFNQWNSEKETILVPEYEYPADKDGALQRNADAVDLASFFIEGLELGGLARDDLPVELKQYAAQLERIVNLLHAQIQLLGQAKNPTGDEIEGAMRAAEKAEFVIDSCITNIYAGLKESRRCAIGQFKEKQSHGSIVPLANRGKVGRNEPCPCGSGKKYKKCCGIKKS